LVLLRMLQGISVGGEYTGSIVFLFEHAPPHRRAFYASFSLIGAIGGILLGSAVGALVTGVSSSAQLATWGWRIPFLVGGLVAIVGMVVRRGIAAETVELESDKSPLKEVFTTYKKPLIQVAGLNMMGSVAFYVVFIYLATWLVEQTGEGRSEALQINTLSMIVLALLLPVVALFSDRIGRKPFLLVGSVGLALFAWPLLWLMHHDEFAMILAGQFGFAILLATFIGVIPVTIAELFPRHCRVSGASIGYNLPFALFGGTAPMVAEWLVSETHNAMSIAWYLIVVAVLAFFVALTVRETRSDT
ncbi:MAG: MFS transporter, partial [Planctomycetales bacterium]